MVFEPSIMDAILGISIALVMLVALGMLAYDALIG
jgi:hypothetical protein